MDPTDSRTAILQARYFHPGEDERAMWERVATFWSLSDKQAAEQFQMLSNLDALTNTPAIANAGRERAQGSACFVLPIEDSLYNGRDSITRTLAAACQVQATGGGTGFSFNNIRARGQLIRGTGKEAPGPVEFLKMFSQVIGRVTQGGIRWGANIGVLRDDHPDIMEFVTCKNNEFEQGPEEDALLEALMQIVSMANGAGEQVKSIILKAVSEYLDATRLNGSIHNFNISVGASDQFMRHGRFGDQRELWDAIVSGAWLNGEPGLLFLDRINEAAPHPEIIESTNPCGEVPLLANEACVLGSVNLARHITPSGQMDYSKLEATVRTLTRMLDTIVTKQDYPLPQIKEVHGRYRKIGVGVMGLADAFIMSGMRYGSPESLSAAGRWAEAIQRFSWDESARLGEKYGYYPGWYEGMPKRRNICCQVVAPTGTISRIARTSFGIEPVYAARQESYILGRKEPFVDFHPLRDDPNFVTTDEIPLDQHVAMLCAVQQHVDQAVSKTCNASEDTTEQQVADAYAMAYEGGAKGITVLRAGSRVRTVLKDHSGKHDHDSDVESPDGPKSKHEFVCVGGGCES